MSTKVIIFPAPQHPEMARSIYRFRKRLFIDELHWNLSDKEGEERDQFDRKDSIYCAMLRDDDLIGSFRAIRCDRPYLSAEVFPYLAQTRPYPSTPDAWEISRLGVLREHRVHAQQLYAAMFAFGWARRARALVALADLGYERFLRAMRIRTRRFGTPHIIGHDLRGRALRAVAGEICLSDQDDELTSHLHALLLNMEIEDEALVLGPDRISA